MSVEDAASQKVSGSANQTLAMTTVLFFTGLAAVSLFGPAAAHLKELLNLTPMQVSFLIAAPTLSGSLLRIPFGAWAGVGGGRRPMLVLMSCAILGMVCLYFKVKELDAKKQSEPGDYEILLGLAVLIGCGIASFTAGVGQISYWFPKAEQGQALGLYGGLSNLAPAVVALILPYALKHLGLANTYLVWLILVVSATSAYALLSQDASYLQLLATMSPEEAKEVASTVFQQELFPAESASQGLKLAARNWKTWALVSIYFTCFGGMVALTVWLPTYWHTVHGLVPTEAGKLTATFGATASLFRVVGGYLADSASGEKACMIGSLFLASGAVALVIFDNDIVPAMIGEVILAVGMGIGNGATFKLIPYYVPEAVGGAAGLIGGLGTFGGFVLPPIMASFVHNMGMPGYSRGFLVFVGLAVVMAIVSKALANLDLEDSEDDSSEACSDEECPSAEEYSAKLMSMMPKSMF